VSLFSSKFYVITKVKQLLKLHNTKAHGSTTIRQQIYYNVSLLSVRVFILA